MLIFHIATPQDFENAKQTGQYTHKSLAIENFIHCSLAHQIDGVLQRYYKGIRPLLMLSIDTQKLTSKLIFEMATIGEEFPHIYGTINMEAIVEIKEILK